jgi:hypothetical protein
MLTDQSASSLPLLTGVTVGVSDDELLNRSMARSFISAAASRMTAAARRIGARFAADAAAAPAAAPATAAVVVRRTAALRLRVAAAFFCGAELPLRAGEAERFAAPFFAATLREAVRALAPPFFAAGFDGREAAFRAAGRAAFRAAGRAAFFDDFFEDLEDALEALLDFEELLFLPPFFPAGDFLAEATLFFAGDLLERDLLLFLDEVDRLPEERFLDDGMCTRSFHSLVDAR